MRTAFIIDIHKNPGLLKFTETKLWFDAKNQTTDWIDDCCIVDSVEDVYGKDVIVINSGDFVVTPVREYIKQQPPGYYDLRDNEHLLKFTPDYSYDIKQVPPYKPGEKQRYIIDNVFRSMLVGPKLIYLEQTEVVDDVVDTACEHLYGVASAWKTAQLANRIGFDKLKSITVFDQCERQLAFAKELHSNSTLPTTVNPGQPCHGEYNPPQEVKDFWHKWHNYPVEFVKLDLFDTPRFKPKSYIWVSNAFMYEPTLFKFGYQYCQNKLKDLLNINNDCKITFN